MTNSEVADLRIPRPLWQHPCPKTTRTHEFKTHIEQKYQLSFAGYEALRQWSIDNLNSFWEEVWSFTGVGFSQPFKKVSFKHRHIGSAVWVLTSSALSRHLTKRLLYGRVLVVSRKARLNYAQNLLYPSANPAQDSLAIIDANENTTNYVTWGELRERVRQCSHSLREKGLQRGDRVAGYVANHSNALVASLAALTIGAIWTAISPDTGVSAVLDRLQQIEPIVLFADNAVIYSGKVHQVIDKVEKIAACLPQLKQCVVFETVTSEELSVSNIIFPNGKAVWYFQFVQGVAENVNILFAQLPADHPVYILYSSGTTGTPLDMAAFFVASAVSKPKCIVHGVVGTLLQLKKEHDIQCSLRPGDKLFYFTTCTWMMWHWLVAALATGVTVVLYDGSPFRPLDKDGNGEMAMPKLIQELGITHFGTSAKYLSILEQKGVKPTQHFKLSSLKAIYSTGSSLAPSTFEYVYRAFSSNLNVASITGGTDIISLFGAPSQISPVYSSEIQIRGLGMAVEVWDSQGQDVSSKGLPGDLVCVKPFPSQPVSFWGPKGTETYKKSCFEAFPGVWHHGDFVRLNPATGGLIMLGRSDGVLKPAGVRFGSSEIYNVLLRHFEEVEDALCIGRRRKDDIDETVVLFIKMKKGFPFSQDLAAKIGRAIKTDLSIRHIPGIIDECPEIPVTINGKKIEVAVKQILCGLNVQTTASVSNAECLQWYQDWDDAHPK